MDLHDVDAIHANLVAHPGMMYVTPDNKKLYTLAPGGVLIFEGGDFDNMDETQLNQFIIDTLIAQLKK